jgi:hypothetical protein
MFLYESFVYNLFLLQVRHEGMVDNCWAMKHFFGMTEGPVMYWFEAVHDGCSMPTVSGRNSAIGCQLFLVCSIWNLNRQIVGQNSWHLVSLISLPMMSKFIWLCFVSSIGGGPQSHKHQATSPGTNSKLFQCLIQNLTIPGKHSEFAL